MQKQKQEVKYRKVKLDLTYLPTKERDCPVHKTVSVQAPQFVECTYDVGLEILRDRDLGNGCFAVYMALLSYRNTKTNDCHPSIDRLHEDFGFNKKTIKRAIDLLYAKGYIDINSGYKNVASNYYFCKEYWYEAWDCDFYQTHAQRRKQPLREERETKEQKELKEAKKEAKEKDAEIERLKKLLEQQSVQTDKQNHQNWCKDLEDDLPY